MSSFPHSELIKLVSFGNEYFETGNMLSGYYPENEASLNHPEIVFVDYMTKLDTPPVLANNILQWFELLKKEGCKKLRIAFWHSRDNNEKKDYSLAGFIGGGGTWLIEAMYDDKSNYWAKEWGAKNENAEKNKGWYRQYGLRAKDSTTANMQFSLAELKMKLFQILNEIALFAKQTDKEWWSKVFEHAIELIDSAAPCEEYVSDNVIVLKNYSLLAQQVLFASRSAWVFGAMGSWNDVLFNNKEEHRKYDALSTQLYDNIVRGVMAATNSF